MDPIERQRRVEAFRTAMRAAGLDDAMIDGLLGQLEQTDKSAAQQAVTYKEAHKVSTAKQELNALHVALKSARIDPDSDAGQQLEQLWVDEGLTVALGQVAQVARYKAERAMGLNPHGMRDDCGRLVGAPLRDASGKLLPW